MGSPLNADQVKLISSVHGGFLYQHLYGVACLLTVGRREGASIIVEHDEDIEAVVGDVRHYIQVKMRNRPLRPSDITGAIAQFEDIRQEHTDGRRSGLPKLTIITNAELGRVLKNAIRTKGWPEDIQIVFPGASSGELPPAWLNIDAAFDWCCKKAREVPFGNLSAETLVWKLAAQVLHAGTGTRERTFQAEDMGELLEQLLIQLQDFPDPPSRYRPQMDEPLLVTDSRIRLIVGFSGSGKTAWASQAALHCPDPITYFDVSNIPSASVPSNLARELAARFIGGRQEGQGGTMLSESTGISVLRACNRLLEDDNITVQVILDNAHCLDASTIRSLVDAAPSLRFLCLAQPWSEAAHIEAFYGVSAERLAGWSEDDVAYEFNLAGAPVTVKTSQQIVNLTSGLPLYVLNAALVSSRDYNGDASAFCAAVERRTHDQIIAQEIILEETFNKFDIGISRVAAILSFSEVPLTRIEVDSLAEIVGLSVTDVAIALRNLRRASVVIGFQGDRLGLHDATRSLAVDTRTLFDEVQQGEILNKLALMLMAALRKERDISRMGFLFRLLPRIGMMDVLINLAGHEMFHEQGDPRTLWTELEIVAEDTSKSISDQFWANDALAYWEGRDGGQPDLRRLNKMKELVLEGALGFEEQISLSFKELAYWSSEGNSSRVKMTYAAARKLKVGASINRLLRFNYAIALFRLESFVDARCVVDKLILEFFKTIGISEEDIIGKRPVELKVIIPKGTDQDDLKRLADCLGLWAGIVVKMGESPLLRRISAMKIYGLVAAARSVVDTGLEAVDDFLEIMAEPIFARKMMEEYVLPTLKENQLTDRILPVRSHYAVVLAWNKEVKAALQEIEALKEYAGTKDEVAMLAERSQYIKNIIEGRIHLRPQIPPSNSMPKILGVAEPRKGKIGKNKPCPCGSGLKFKHCCGKS
ncbi:MAG: SEC-C metal-binding domain-containing protein [Halopseudomonas aestusnigri]